MKCAAGVTECESLKGSRVIYQSKLGRKSSILAVKSPFEFLHLYLITCIAILQFSRPFESWLAFFALCSVMVVSMMLTAAAHFHTHL